MRTATIQEEFWRGEFGDGYTIRNDGDNWVASNIALFSKILSNSPITSAIEFGANRGLNLRALKLLFPGIELAGVEINASACRELEKIGGIEIHNKSIYDYVPNKKYDLALIHGVMIHLAPEKLSDAYHILYESSQKYISIAEYYSPKPEEIPYRGHREMMFRRDFAKECRQAYPDLKIRNYGFAYIGDPNFPQDDLTWFLMERGK